MFQLLHFPELATWGQQLANILPLGALLEFVDIEKKLHILELSGFCPYWNWPLTPQGARLLLSDEDTTDACCLDRDGRAPVLHCMDCKFGNAYPSSAPTTIRLLNQGIKILSRVDNFRVQEKGKKARRHTLDLFVIQQVRLPTKLVPRYMKPFTNMSSNYIFVSIFGWTSWLVLLVICAISSLYIALGYLLLMPVTGFAIGLRFGGEARGLIGLEEPGDSTRLGIATNGLNSTDWWAFYGPKNAVNGLLNRPLLRNSPPRRQSLACWMIRICAACQWSLAIASCARQSWDAFMVTLWIAFCALAMTYLYPPEQGAIDWLRYGCALEIERIRVRFTARRSLLGALLYLNPDRETTEWLDQVLSKNHKERRDWEAAVFEYIETGAGKEHNLAEYWFEFVREGVEVGEQIRGSLMRRLDEDKIR
jgi:hypothetical protein